MFASGKTAAVASAANYIEEVFSTYLYTGNGSTQTITNGIDLSTYGGLVWAKMRSNGSATGNVLFDTARGASQKLETNTTGASSNWTPYGVSAFGSTGFTVADDGAGNYVTNNSGVNYASWTFRKQPKFFDVVTYTGTGSAQNIAHNLGSVPGCIIVKNLDALTNWAVYHRSLGGTYITRLNRDWASDTGYENWANTDPTSTVFTVGNGNATNGSGYNYVAYVFAHDAGGFGLTGTDNVISCGSYTGNGSSTGPTVTLGYEPQWVMIKNASNTGDWVMFDNMRGLTVGDGDAFLYANTSAAESTGATRVGPTATGFYLKTVSSNLNTSGETYIYIAIRRGPMKVPTSGTSMFAPTTWTGTGAALQQNVGINYDSFMQWRRNGGYSTPWMDKLRGFGYSLYTQSTNAEVNQTAFIAGPKQNNYINFVDGTYNLSGEPWLNYAFVRAPSFFDVVCYTGTGSATTFTHNLGVTPELMIVKNRSSAGYGWLTYSATLGATKYLQINSTAAEGTVSTYWNNTAPTSSVFSIGTAGATNASGDTFVAYLFATCAGVSKVGSYTGTGTTKQIDCGFTGGARFVLIKRTDSTGDWYVWDSARGIVSGNDPYLLLNSTAAETTGTDYIDPYSAGFEISSTAPAAINASGGTFIFLAIA